MKRITTLAVVAGFLVLVASALAASPLTGSYKATVKGKTSQLNGTWVLTFVSNGFYTVAKEPKASTVLISGGSTVTGKLLELADHAGPLACKAPGVYSFTLSGKTLQLKKVKDTCSGRLAILASGPWSKT